ncbi:acyl-CoA dehydrogenase [Caenimonas soli]|uniref:acyl-CoA dehydrogenase n=1 Tax=Caenimonas soli TaxID=2735555 RepID=UPI001F38261C|nr:acyl-CoA dehydrogenase [Caenimonas soli]
MYSAPLAEFEFLLRYVVKAEGVLELAAPGVGLGDVMEIVRHAGTFATEVLDPLNSVGDEIGNRLEGGNVSTAPGFKDAFKAYTAGGWIGLAVPELEGGQGLPHFVLNAVDEIWNAANMAFALCPGLTYGAITALIAGGSPALRAAYLPNMIAGRWTGTMNLTEPQAGTDLSSIRTTAELAPDGNYRIRGQKIFITWGDHDLSENIVHLVLARLPDAPAGLAGLSLFLVPKFLVRDDGSIGARNDVECVSIERKLGIHASPTCVLQYGANEGAVGYLVGVENKGLAGMFVMMNSVRMGVGVQALGVADRAYQRAVAYAEDRVQGTVIGAPKGAPISHHPDVRRMLLSMKTLVAAMRCLSLQVGAWLDLAGHAQTEAERVKYQRRVDFLVPIVKGWFTESTQRITYDAVQVHGGMGFIEETGIAQLYRDARILTIYEGTTAIQANDLVGRKLFRDGGDVAETICAEIDDVVEELRSSRNSTARKLSARLMTAVAALRRSSAAIIASMGAQPRSAYAASVAYLELWGVVAGGWMHARMLLAAVEAPLSADQSQMQSKVSEADFYANHHLPHAISLADVIEASEDTGVAIRFHF